MKDKTKFKIDQFDLDKLIEMICNEYGYTPEELRSSFRYGKLPETRQLLFLVLDGLGATNLQISQMTGYKKSRISVDSKRARYLVESQITFRKTYEGLVKMFRF